jgi:cobyrinic acid a,c-diamide synthase
MVTRLPRVVIAAPASGHGKTTIATGLMAALAAAGHRVSAHKIGPDYIDPGYHALATGRPGRNLDPHLVGTDKLVPLLLHGAATPVPADIAVIEGVMGLFDGAIGREGFASTAHVAGLVGAPVILVVDISSSSRTIAAVVHGLSTFDPDVRIAGVIINKAGSERHATEVRQALEAGGMPVLGVVRRDDGISAPSRHLGLVPAAERGDAGHALDRLAAQIADRVDLAAVVRIARTATDLTEQAWDPAAALSGLLPTTAGPGPVIAVAGGRAFTFRYPETDELLTAAGCRPVVFDPVEDEALPAGTAGIYLGGGFPEVHAAGLAGNIALRAALSCAISAGIPTVAECAGLLYLTRTVDGAPMVGVLDATAAMTPRLTLSYRTAVAPNDSLLAPAGYRATGHEFHRTTVTPMASPDDAGWVLDGVPAGFSRDPAGTGAATLHASYLHTHWAGHPLLAARFAAAARRWAAAPRPPRRTTATGHRVASVRPARELHGGPATLEAGHAEGGNPGVADVDLQPHGDRDIADHLVDFAVNVRVPGPPDWLAEAITATTAALGSYPRPAAAISAVARRHQRPADQVLLTSGGAEAFTLLARGLSPAQAVIVHPQFTEPEAALLTAGHAVQRVLLHAADGFALRPERIPEGADLVMIGNPTNPTSTLHPAALLRGLARPGRVLVVDEAFIDAVPGEAESLAVQQLPGVLVIRSLTKTWGIAGLRAGYVLGDPELIGLLAAQQPPWSVSSPALAAIEACCSDRARAEAERATGTITAHRKVLIDGLADLGLPVAGTPRAPFVLVDAAAVVPAGQPAGWLRERLRDSGFAVRRGDTFPGLGPSWIRLAVREPAVARRLLQAVAALTTRERVG